MKEIGHGLEKHATEMIILYKLHLTHTNKVHEDWEGVGAGEAWAGADAGGGVGTG